MATILIAVGVVLLIFAIAIICSPTQKCSEKPNCPPPLPPRVNVGIPSPIVSQAQTRTSSSSPTRALPPRRFSSGATANVTRRTLEGSNGPRGIKPIQFPCCPFDKQRNVPGERQVIFWDSGENCYHCSRGHRFKSNGKLL